MTINELNLQKQANTITLNTAGKYVAENIELNLKITKAVLTTDVGSNSFDIEIPNGASGTLTLHFSVDSQGNTTIT